MPMTAPQDDAAPAREETPPPAQEQPDASASAKAQPPAPAAPPPRQRRDGTCAGMLIGCLIGVALLAGGGVLLLAMLAGLAGSALEGLPIEKPGRRHGFRQVKVESGASNAAVAVVGLYGAIMGRDPYTGEEGVAERVVKMLRAAREDSTVKAVILEVNSPGGGLTASDRVYQEVLALKEQGKPVVAYVEGMAGSGGYWVIAPSDHIVLNPTGMVGSIGVIMMRFQVSGLLQKVGVQAEPIKSTSLKDFASPFRDLREEEKAILQRQLQYWHSRFVEVVVEGRPDLGEAKVRTLANGQMYIAPNAVRHGLVDEEGYLEEAIAKARELSGVQNARVFRYVKPQTPWEKLMRAEAAPAHPRVVARAVVDEVLDRASTPRVEARWRAAGGLDEEE
jgi:protease-4